MSVTLKQMAGQMADDLESTRLNIEHGVAAQIRAATTSTDYTDAADHLDVLRDAIGLHGIGDDPELGDQLAAIARRIRTIADLANEFETEIESSWTDGFNAAEATYGITTEQRRAALHATKEARLAQDADADEDTHCLCGAELPYSCAARGADNRPISH